MPVAGQFMEMASSKSRVYSQQVFHGLLQHMHAATSPTIDCIDPIMHCFASFPIAVCHATNVLVSNRNRGRFVIVSNN